MNTMVQKLLSLNQLEFGENVATMERFDILALIKAVVESSQILAEAKDIDITYSQGRPLYVWGDEFMVEEVVTNYLSNAINHCSGDKKIDIKVEEKDGTVRTTVFNTGDPIPEESIDKIWTKFYKVDKARTRAYGGSGIGLSIVKAIMESMNQNYGVKNYDNGVAFWFELSSRSK
jgi:signal transduction histidine kinase